MRHTTAMLLALAWGAGCSSESGATGEHTHAHRHPHPESGGETAEAEEDVVEAESVLPLADLHADDQLTFLVRMGDGEEEEAHLRVARVVERGGSRAVKLTPVGVPGEAGQTFIAWIVADDEGLVGLEAHVSLGEPSFVPIDESGHLVTEAESNVAWRVPARWLALETRAFHNDPVEGWRLVDASTRIEGPVRMEHCVDLERREGGSTQQLRVCRNVGIVGLSVSPEQPEEREAWRLMDLGQAPEELTRSIAGPSPAPAEDG